ncbi:DUF4296 domain-containing protein [Bacteroides sp.]|uniref:DUF4296 domain-containing protein n=1 Tax=Bacteroides sp. TaxID=29523 RepID=UPI003AB5426A
MKGKNRIQWYSVILLAFCLTACQVKRPKTVLPDAKMENLLYDYHIAKAMGEEVPYNESYKRVLYIESVFKKYGITQADFDSSMLWYARNPETLTKIYEKVNLRLKAERDGINHLIALRDNKPKESLPGDSIDVWIWQHIYQLTGMPLDNKLTFTLPSDTNFYDRDTLRWSVRFRFHNGVPDSIHAPLMAMQILYEKNDSVISAIQKVKNSGVETISLFADTLGKIKEVRGFIYYPMQTSLQPLLADRISLTRYHATDSLMITPKDSLQQATDSIGKDSIEKKPAEIKNAQEQEGATTNRRNVRPRPTVREIEKPRK